MPKTRPTSPPEFRRLIVDLVRSGRNPSELAREFEPSAQAIRNWVAQANRQDGRAAAKPTAIMSAMTADETRRADPAAAREQAHRVERDILSWGVTLPFA